MLSDEIILELQQNNKLLRELSTIEVIDNGIYRQTLIQIDSNNKLIKLLELEN